jgi:hypothetical protein
MLRIISDEKLKEDARIINFVNAAVAIRALIIRAQCECTLRATRSLRAPLPRLCNPAQSSAARFLERLSDRSALPTNHIAGKVRSVSIYIVFHRLVNINHAVAIVARIRERLHSARKAIDGSLLATKISARAHFFL